MAFSNFFHTLDIGCNRKSREWIMFYPRVQQKPKRPTHEWM